MCEICLTSIFLFVDMAPNASMIGDLSTDEDLDGSNYDMWHQKI